MTGQEPPGLDPYVARDEAGRVLPLHDDAPPPSPLEWPVQASDRERIDDLVVAAAGLHRALRESLVVVVYLTGPDRDSAPPASMLDNLTAAFDTLDLIAKRIDHALTLDTPGT